MKVIQETRRAPTKFDIYVFIRVEDETNTCQYFCGGNIAKVHFLNYSHTNS